MTALLKKELNIFFSSIIGYIVVILFLLVNSLFLWLVPDENLFDAGYADLSLFFENAPYVFLLLIPAITMRSFAEEKSMGTLETIITKPVTELQIIMAKFLSSFILVLFALLPTLIYYVSLYTLGNPVGNIDTGSVIGSYIGLLMLASVYVAIGVFSSSLTQNQIVSLLIAFTLCILMTEGFQLMSRMSENSSSGLLKSFNLLLSEFGIYAHYKSMSRGVIDTRDVVYFLSANIFFILCTLTVLRKRNW